MAAKRDEDFFWQQVDEGKLCAQQCEACSVLRHPPLPCCAECGSDTWAAKELSGRGHIYTWIISKHPTQTDENPRMVILVDLEEGLRMVSNLVDPQNIRVGAPVTLELTEVDGERLPCFRTVAE